ncbi:MAG: DUF1080 domain-containing protein, partial [Planctomycetaceae bacterium]|nr:DUF1080 domain-containing protein [Planctomycetaceae bacterium]
VAPVTAQGTPNNAVSVFPYDAASEMRDIRDGTSNTLMLLRVAPPRAPIWTSPEDWIVNAVNAPLQFEIRANGTTALAIADGRVLDLPSSALADTEFVRAIVTRAGGESFDWNKATQSTAAKPTADDGWTDLFNGRDLSGWKSAVNNDWSVANGSLVSDAGPRGVLWTEQNYADFEMDFEFKLSRGANSGVFLRYPSNTDGLPRGLEVQLLDDPNHPFNPGETRYVTGSLHGLAVPRVENYRTAQWNRMTIRNLGRTVTVTLNGQAVLSKNTTQLTVPDDRRDAVHRNFGYIGLQTYGAGTDGQKKIEFRNMRIRRLNFAGDTVGAASQTTSSAPAAEQGSTVLFNGRDLAGWTVLRDPSGWFVKDGVLTARPHQDLRQGPAWIRTNEQFSDFELELEYKLPADGNSGVFLRVPADSMSSEDDFIEIQLLDDDAAKYAGIKPEHVNGSLYGLKAAQPRLPSRPNQWRKMSIRAAGQALHVAVDGATIMDANTGDYAAERNRRPGLFRTSGYIALQRHSSPAEFRNIRIRDLSSNVSTSAAPAPKVPFPQSAQFTAARPISEVNVGTARNAFPWIAPDGLTLYWTREGEGTDSAIMQATRSSADAPFGSIRPVLQPARLATVSPDGLEIVALADANGDDKLDELCHARRSSTSTAFTNPQQISAFAAIPGPKGSAFSDDGRSLLVVSSPGTVGPSIYRATRSGIWAPWQKPESIVMENPPREMDRITWPSFASGGAQLLFSYSDPNNRSVEWGGVADATSNPLRFAKARPLLLDGQPVVTRGGRYCGATGELFYTHPIGDPPYKEMQIYVAKADQVASASGGAAASPTPSAVSTAPRIVPRTERRYVNAAAPSQGAGRSWADAYQDLQTALEQARPSDSGVKEIWIAKGTYLPAAASGPRTATFQLIDGVSLYGGFDGRETQLAQRNVVQNRTILSGDLKGDSDGVMGHNLNKWEDNV